MKKINLTTIKKLRERTGAGVKDVKEALLKGGSFEKALKLLQQRGVQILAEKSSRSASQGVIKSYIHLGGKVGAMVELFCETDFVAQSEPMERLAYELAVHVAGMAPQYISWEEVPLPVRKGEKDPARFASEVCLLNQPLIKDPQTKVEELIQRVALQVREKIGIRRFVRFALGEETQRGEQKG